MTRSLRAPKFTHKWLYLAAIALSLMVLLIPLWQSGFIVTDDGGWMVIRLSAFYQSLRQGQFPVRLLGRLNHGYGYPVSNFLYPGFLYMGSFIHALGFSFVDTVKMIFSLSIVGFATFLFLWLRTFFSGWASAFAVIASVLAPYVVHDIYERGSVGEVFAFLWISACFYSIESGKLWLFISSFAMLILAHNTLAALFVPIIVTYLWVRRKVHHFVPSLLLGFGLTAFFWFPALYERRFVLFDAAKVAHASSYFIELGRGWLLGPLQILAAVFVLASAKKRDGIVYFFLIVFFVSIALTIPISSVIWTWEPLVKFVQFPFRFLAIATIAGAWLTALAMHSLSRRVSVSLLVAGIAFCIWSIWGSYSQIAYENKPEGFYTTNEGTTTVQDEYMPRWVIDKPSQGPSSRIEFFRGKGDIIIKQANHQSIDVRVRAAEDSIMQINSIYYPGWGILVNDVFTRPDYGNRMGVMRVNIPRGDHHIIANFRETVSRFLADAISVVSVLLSIGYCLSQRKNFKK